MDNERNNPEGRAWQNADIPPEIREAALTDGQDEDSVDVLYCTVTSVIYSNPESGYAVLAVKDTDGASYRTGYHKREFRTSCGSRSYIRYITMKHGEGFLKESIATGRLQQIRQERIPFRIITYSKKI